MAGKQICWAGGAPPTPEVELLVPLLPLVAVTTLTETALTELVLLVFDMVLPVVC